jgi:GTP1/Obg family GTP-binding protein
MGVDQPAAFLPHIDSDANPDCDSDADVVAERNSPEPQVNFSLNLSSLDLSLSPTGKSTDVVQSVDERRISTGTYVTSPTFANLRDVASPRLKPVAEDVLEISGVEPFIDQSTVVQGDIDHAHVDQSYVSPADESHDEISILIQNQMRLSRGLKVEAVDRLDSGRVLDLADQSILVSKKGQGHQSFLQNATISDFG